MELEWKNPPFKEVNPTSRDCVRCGNNFPITSEFFHRSKENSTGFRSACKTCVSVEKALFYQNNKEKYSEKNREWKAKNPDRAKFHATSYYHKNKEKYEDYRKNNKKYFSDYRKKYRKENKEKFVVYSNRRRAKIANSKNDFYTLEDVLSLYGIECYLCYEEIDMLAPRSTKHPGWELGLHIDHVVPISKGGDNTLSNVRPSHAICNIRKGSKLK